MDNNVALFGQMSLLNAIILISLGLAFGGRYRMAREGSCVVNNGDGTVKFNDSAGVITTWGPEVASFIPKELPAPCWTIDESSFTNYDPELVFIMIMCIFGPLFLSLFCRYIYLENKAILYKRFLIISWILFGITFIIGIMFTTLNNYIYLEKVECTGLNDKSDNCDNALTVCECSDQPCVNYFNYLDKQVHKAKFEYWSHRPTFYPVDCWIWTRQNPDEIDGGDYITLNNPQYVLECFAIYIGCHVIFNILVMVIYQITKKHSTNPNAVSDISFNSV